MVGKKVDDAEIRGKSLKSESSEDSSVPRVSIQVWRLFYFNLVIPAEAVPRFQRLIITIQWFIVTIIITLVLGYLLCFCMPAMLETRWMLQAMGSSEVVNQDSLQVLGDDALGQ